MCVRLEDARQQNIVEYEWDKDILKYSQRNLNFGHGQEISYDLYKIEGELALWLVRNKALLEHIENNGLPLEKVAYHMELFETCQVILEEIKKKIPQEPIPHEKVALIIYRNLFYRDICKARDVADVLYRKSLRAVVRA